MLVANREAPTSGHGRLRSARKKLALSADDFFRTARYRPRMMLELKTARQMHQWTSRGKKDFGSPRMAAPLQGRPPPPRPRPPQAKAEPLRLEKCRSIHCAVSPPSMIQLQPVIDRDDGPNKKATKFANSCTVMNLFTKKRSRKGSTTI